MREKGGGERRGKNAIMALFSGPTLRRRAIENLVELWKCRGTSGGSDFTLLGYIAAIKIEPVNKVKKN